MRIILDTEDVAEFMIQLHRAQEAAKVLQELNRLEHQKRQILQANAELFTAAAASKPRKKYNLTPEERQRRSEQIQRVVAERKAVRLAGVNLLDTTK